MDIPPETLYDRGIAIYGRFRDAVEAGLDDWDAQKIMPLLPPVSNALQFFKLARDFAAPYDSDLGTIIHFGDECQWDHFWQAVDVLMDRVHDSAPALLRPHLAEARPRKYGPQFVHLMCRYARAFMVIAAQLDDITAHSDCEQRPR